MLERFLPRFNARFRVPAAEPEPAYRPLDPALDLDAVLAFRHARTVARDNTVKYRWRTLQLLPGPERTSYAGTRVVVVERPGGELSVPAPRRDDPLATGSRTCQPSSTSSASASAATCRACPKTDSTESASSSPATTHLLD